MASSKNESDGARKDAGPGGGGITMGQEYYVRHTKRQGGTTYISLPPQLIEASAIQTPGTIVLFTPLPGMICAMGGAEVPTFRGCFAVVGKFVESRQLHSAHMMSKIGPSHVASVGECLMCGRVVLCNDVAGLNFCLACTDSWVTLSYITQLMMAGGA
jgi:hypothetical protein